MASREDTLIERLFQAENPREIFDWHKYDAHYVETCGLSAEDVPGLIDLSLKWVEPGRYEEADDSSTDDDLDDERAILLPVTAWRALADLKAEAAIQPLADMLGNASDEFDDWMCEELPRVFGKLGVSTIEPLNSIVTSDDKSNFARLAAIASLRRVAEYHPDAKPRIVAFLTDQLAQGDEEHYELNTHFMLTLVELRAKEAAETIERAFAANLIEIDMMGTWEDVRKILSVKGLGLEMPAEPVCFMRRRGRNRETDAIAEAQAARLLIQYNQSQRSNYSLPEPIVRGPKVGRNEPCPCGSRKKFKKCCGG